MYTEHFWVMIENYFIALQNTLDGGSLLSTHHNGMHLFTKHQPTLNELYIKDRGIYCSYTGLFGVMKTYAFAEIDDYDYIDSMCELLPMSDAEKCELLNNMAKKATEKAFIFIDQQGLL